MCGISALLNLQKEQQIFTSQVENMLKAISHRGPDSLGVKQFDDFVFGLNRLSILDLSSKGNQPMSKHKMSIVFNGLIYNYVELKMELEKEGYKFESKSDTEVILTSYFHWGKDCVKKFNGMWAFIIYDEERKSLFVSRDRYGIKPLYYYSQNQRLYIASEIKAFTPTKDWSPKKNDTRVYDFVKFGLKNHTNETMFEGVYSFPPATNVSIDTRDGKMIFESYSQVDYSTHTKSPSFQEASIIFRDLLESSIALRLRSDVEIGMSLSGGLDSSAIAICLNKFDSIRKTKAICSISKDHKYNEWEYANAIANKYQYPLNQTLFEESNLTQLKETVFSQDEPFPGASVIAQNLVYKKANELGLKVMFSGQGADEYLMGYDAFLPLYFLNRNPLFHPLEFLSFSWKHRKTLWRYNVLGKKAEEPDMNLNYDSSSIYQPDSICDLKERAHQYFTKTVLPSLLHFEDHNSMAYGIESRLPFLDYRLVDFCFSLPEEFFIKKGIRKKILRESFKADFPQKIYKRYDKSAFSNPLQSWLKNNEVSYREILIKNGYNSNKVKDLNTLWRMLGYHYWKQNFNVE
jgi:asparagine synthase (glutamine-hydrolysing)